MRYYSAPRRALRGVRQLLYPRRCPFCNAVLGSISSFGPRAKVGGFLYDVGTGRLTQLC